VNLFKNRAQIALAAKLFILPLIPGFWGGTLEYNQQSTPFFIEFRLVEAAKVEGPDQPDEESAATLDGGAEAHETRGVNPGKSAAPFTSLEAFLYLPVTHFHGMPLGSVQRSDSVYTAGVVRFTYDEDEGVISGTFRGSRPGIRFTLTPADGLPDAGTGASDTAGWPEKEPLWTYDTGIAIWADAALDNDLLFVTASDGGIHCLDAVKGTLKWHFKAGGATFSRPAVADGSVFVATDNGYLHRLDGRTGEPVWTIITDTGGWVRSLPDHSPPGYDTRGAAPVISNGVVYLGSPGGTMYAIDATNGSEIWRFDTQGPVLSTPAVADGQNLVIFGSNDHHVYALDTRSGELRWSYDTGQPVISSPVLHGNLAIAGSRSADLFALDIRTGKPVWTRFFWFSWIESSGVIADETLFIGSSDVQLLLAIDPSNGSLIWERNTGGSPWAIPAVSANTVFSGVFGNRRYMIDHKGAFIAADRATGDVKWYYRMQPSDDTHIYGVVSSPVYHDGMVFFGGLDGLIYAFRE
jgi:outer membrane protein assembly factor BamB